MDDRLLSRQHLHTPDCCVLKINPDTERQRIIQRPTADNRAAADRDRHEIQKAFPDQVGQRTSGAAVQRRRTATSDGRGPYPSACASPLYFPSASNRHPAPPSASERPPARSVSRARTGNKPTMRKIRPRARSVSTRCSLSSWTASGAEDPTRSRLPKRYPILRKMRRLYSYEID